MAKPLKITCVGEAMVEISLDGAGAGAVTGAGGGTGAEAGIGFAGDALNTAVYLRRALGGAHEVAFVSVLGTDPLSARMLAFIAAEDVSVRGITRNPDRLPGLYAIDTDANGERSFHYWREQSAARTLFRDGFEGLRGFDVVFFSAITLAILPPDVRCGFLDWLKGWSGLVVFDSNHRPRLWESAEAARQGVARAWQRADIGLPSLDDEMALFGDRDEAAVLRRLRACGVRRGALKRGARGPVPIGGPSGGDADYPVADRVVDTTAAGDSFNGGYLAAVLTGVSERDAMVAGHRLAVGVIGRAGAIVPVGVGR